MEDPPTFFFPSQKPCRLLKAGSPPPPLPGVVRTGHQGCSPQTPSFCSPASNQNNFKTPQEAAKSLSPLVQGGTIFEGGRIAVPPSRPYHANSLAPLCLPPTQRRVLRPEFFLNVIWETWIFLSRDPTLEIPPNSNPSTSRSQQVFDGGGGLASPGCVTQAQGSGGGRA